MEAMFKVQRTTYKNGESSKWETISDWKPEGEQRKYFEELRTKGQQKGFLLRSNSKNEFRLVKVDYFYFTFRLVKKY